MVNSDWFASRSSSVTRLVLPAGLKCGFWLLECWSIGCGGGGGGTSLVESIVLRSVFCSSFSSCSIIMNLNRMACTWRDLLFLPFAKFQWRCHQSFLFGDLYFVSIELVCREAKTTVAHYFIAALDMGYRHLPWPFPPSKNSVFLVTKAAS